jgi:hypothetical protein
MRRVLLFAVCMLLLLAGSAKADYYQLYLGGSFSYPIYSLVNGSATSYGGGSVDPSTLNGTALPYVYCVGRDIEVWVPGLYDQTIVNRAGNIYGSQFTGDAVPHADQVAWLLANYGVGGQGAPAVILQAAIWTVIDPGVYSLDTSKYGTSLNNQYALMVAGAQSSTTVNISSLLWMTPGTGGSNHYQGLVTSAGFGAPVPIPSAVWLLASGLVGMVAVRRRRRGKREDRASR